MLISLSSVDFGCQAYGFKRGGGSEDRRDCKGIMAKRHVGVRNRGRMFGVCWAGVHLV